MGPNTKTARIAGLLYLVLAIGALFAFSVRSQLIAPEDAAATVRNLAAHELLFRLSIVGDLLGQAAFALLPLVLYALLKTVDRTQASLMVVLVLVAVPVALVNLQHLWAILPLLHGDGSAASAASARAQVTACLNAFQGGVLVAQVFWGSWLIPFGWLVYRSGFLPKVLGLLVMLGSVGYLLQSFSKLLAPTSATLASVASMFTAASGVAEFAMLLWLLIMGVRERPADGAGAPAGPTSTPAS